MEGRYAMKDFFWAADYASRPETMAAYLDQLITTGDTIEKIVEQAVTGGKKRKLRTKFTKATIHAHIRFRVQQAASNKVK